MYCGWVKPKTTLVGYSLWITINKKDRHGLLPEYIRIWAVCSKHTQTSAQCCGWYLQSCLLLSSNKNHAFYHCEHILQSLQVKVNIYLDTFHLSQKKQNNLSCFYFLIIKMQTMILIILTWSYQFHIFPKIKDNKHLKKSSLHNK